MDEIIQIFQIFANIIVFIIAFVSIIYAIKDIINRSFEASFKRIHKIIFKKNCEIIDVIKGSNEFYYNGDKYPISDVSKYYKYLKVVKKGDMLYYNYVAIPLFGKAFEKYFKVNIQDKARQEISYKEFIDSVADDVIIKYVRCTYHEIEDNEDCRSMKSWEGKDNKKDVKFFIKFLLKLIGYILLIMIFIGIIA